MQRVLLISSERANKERSRGVYFVCVLFVVAGYLTDCSRYALLFRVLSVVALRLALLEQRVAFRTAWAHASLALLCGPLLIHALASPSTLEAVAPVFMHFFPADCTSSRHWLSLALADVASIAFHYLWLLPMHLSQRRQQQQGEEALFI